MIASLDFISAVHTMYLTAPFSRGVWGHAILKECSQTPQWITIFRQVDAHNNITQVSFHSQVSNLDHPPWLSSNDFNVHVVERSKPS